MSSRYINNLVNGLLDLLDVKNKDDAARQILQKLDPRLCSNNDCGLVLAAVAYSIPALRKRMIEKIPAITRTIEALQRFDDVSLRLLASINKPIYSRLKNTRIPALPTIMLGTTVGIFELQSLDELLAILFGAHARKYTEPSLVSLGEMRVKEDIERISADISDVLNSLKGKGSEVGFATSIMLAKLPAAPVLAKIYNILREGIGFIIKSAEGSGAAAGVPVGIRPLRSLREVQYLTPAEKAMLVRGAANDALADYAVYRILSKQAMVYDRKATPRVVMFIDNSGSMYGWVQCCGAELNTASIAAIIAQALIDEGITKPEDVYAFTTTTMKLPTDVLRKSGVAAALLAVPTGGTSITSVYSTIEELVKKHGANNTYLIITDAVDVVDPKYLLKIYNMARNKIYNILIGVSEKEARNKARDKTQEKWMEYAVFAYKHTRDKTLFLPYSEFEKGVKGAIRLVESAVRRSALAA